MKLKIAHIDYNITTRSLDIFTIGCNGCCKGCCNPEIKDFNSDGMSLEDAVLKIRELYRKFNHLIDRFIIVGGDPVDGEKITGGVSVLLDDLKLLTDKPIFLFTRYNIEKIPQNLKDKVDYIKIGEYKPELLVDKNMWYGINLATSNQKIYKKVKNDWILQRSEEWK